MKISGNIVDVLHERIFPGTITVEDGHIVDISREGGKTASTYILPGFVDSHIHIESTLMLPSRYAPMALRHGVTAAVCDPHEIANVLGIEGIDYMITDGATTPFHFHWMCPSCVPSTPFETAGATLDSQAVATLLRRPDIGGLAEMMNAAGVLMGDPEVMAKIEACRAIGKPIDGHAPGLRGAEAQQYIDAGISTDHECTSLEEAQERLALGQKILIREGSAACDFEELVPLLGERGRTASLHQVMFCSDDKYADELEAGYIDDMVRRAVAQGMPLWNVLRAACVTPVLHYGLPQGLLQVGDAADFIVVDNLQDFNVLETHTASQEEALSLGREAKNRVSAINRFEALPIGAGAIPEPKTRDIIVATEGSIYTHRASVGTKADTAAGEVNKLVVLNRYEPHAQPATAYIQGFHLAHGALASTIAHDSHNLIAVGADNESIALAINTLIDCKGGLAVTDGRHTECLPLPIAGLMSPEPASEVGAKHLSLKQLAHTLGCPMKAPFMTLAFMALPVIPELKLTDRGLFDSLQFQFVTP